MAEYIERDKVLDAILQLPPKMDEKGYGWLGRMGVWQMLSDFPSADVQPVKWIPVTERLPERFYAVIVCGKMKYSFEKEYERFVDVACFDEPDKEKDQDRWATFNDWYEGQQEYEITHWMPLPEPPKDGETDG